LVGAERDPAFGRRRCGGDHFAAQCLGRLRLGLPGAGANGAAGAPDRAERAEFRILAINLPAVDFPAACFGNLYHQRWRIKEAFKRLKHRLHPESVSRLSQQALIIDAAAKVLADRLAPH
jgi:IS4 transposase